MVMDLLVKGMKMPKSCGKCPMMRPGNYKGQAFPCTCHAKDCFPIKPSELDLRDGLCPLIELPSADVAEVKHGKWLWDGYVYGEPYVCNCCGARMDYESNFCPHCGARMEEWLVSDEVR